ncbi:serine/threonine-protein kinase [Corallococcus llansteffanensis]|uniref:Serine/threonine protein kinase n=1 Tax=Corallococcus llansteffanensis TaxID=2316731 RepID=A0A3A8PZ06_9BACT|nr:serine/threonine-protein kinase [Corallococcus llansteffanensis]RKH60301.1 serine/threonine protein kinase [Corallococcus llansteffanensis]
MRPPPATLMPGEQVLGYTVERQLGQGGFGTVYLARNGAQPCALKLLHLPRVGERVKREVTILLQLGHPNVVGLQGFGLWPPAEPRFAVIAMEYVDGRRLDVWADEENPTARQVARVVLDVALALAATHAAGVLHRDVKEANVMVRAADGLAKLVDFGIGDYEGARELTEDLLPPGTPEYRAPEAWRYFREHVRVPGARYTAGVSDDLWALGLVLYALLTARHPFDGADDASFIEAVLTSEPPSPHEVNALVPRALSDVCMRLLEKWPEVRTSSAQSAASALEAALRSADATWDVPLCDAFGEDTATTEGGRDSEDRWLHAPLHRPRRGKRAPPEKKPAPHEDAASAAEAPPLGTTVRVSPRMQQSFDAWGVLALALVLVVAGAVLVWWTLRISSPALTRQEVAPSGKSPQADRAAAPTGPEATAAAVALPATLQEVSATVTMQPTEPPSLQPPSKPAKKGMRVMARAVSTAVACTALACPGPQVRPAPPPEPCPIGAEKAMKKLGVRVGSRHPVSFTLTGDASVVSIGEGPVEVELLADWFDMPDSTMLSGRAIVRDRVYVRLNWATTPEGDTFPVCLNLESLKTGSGLEREPGEDSPSRARIYSAQLARAVSEFP